MRGLKRLLPAALCLLAVMALCSADIAADTGDLAGVPRALLAAEEATSSIAPGEADPRGNRRWPGGGRPGPRPFPGPKAFPNPRYVPDPNPYPGPYPKPNSGPRPEPIGRKILGSTTDAGWDAGDHSCGGSWGKPRPRPLPLPHPIHDPHPMPKPNPQPLPHPIPGPIHPGPQPIDDKTSNRKLMRAENGADKEFGGADKQYGGGGGWSGGGKGREPKWPKPGYDPMPKDPIIRIHDCNKGPC